MGAEEKNPVSDLSNPWDFLDEDDLEPEEEVSAEVAKPAQVAAPPPPPPSEPAPSIAEAPPVQETARTPPPLAPKEPTPAPKNEPEQPKLPRETATPVSDDIQTLRTENARLQKAVEALKEENAMERCRKGFPAPEPKELVKLPPFVVSTRRPVNRANKSK